MRLGSDDVRYVIFCPSNYQGEFEFLTHTQSHWSSNLKKTKKELEDLIDDHMHDFDPPLSRKEALEDMGNPVIYQLTVKEVK